MFVIRTFAWLICVVYSTIPLFWMMIHPRPHFWRARSRSPYRILVPVWVAVWIALGIATMHWRSVMVYSADWTWLPAALLFLLGIWLYSRAGLHFSWGQLGGMPEVVANHREQRLVTTGIRARVRHPVYLGHLCEMFAWSIGTGLIVCWALTGFAMITGAVMIRMEDAELEKRFGDKYVDYRQRVGAILPKF